MKDDRPNENLGVGVGVGGASPELQCEWKQPQFNCVVFNYVVLSGVLLD